MNQKINKVAIVLCGVLALFVIMQGMILAQYKELADDSRQYIKLLQHKTDSMIDANYDLRDSIITLKYGQY